MKTKTGVELIAAERARQIKKEGWNAQHDDDHSNGELAEAAACYAHNAGHPRYMPEDHLRWPWDEKWWKPKDAIRDLVRAGALIAAEIDRLQRANKVHVEEAS